MGAGPDSTLIPPLIVFTLHSCHRASTADPRMGAREGSRRNARGRGRLFDAELCRQWNRRVELPPNRHIAAGLLGA
jgi:hypothetical protein